MHATPLPGARQRGVATLFIVGMLLFMTLLMTAYANRNLIVEQRTSANHYRATLAFEAAEAGLQWAMSQLNGGRIDAACTPSAAAEHTTFRDRYLRGDAATGAFVPVDPAAAAHPGCVHGAAGWTCSCPASGDATLTPAPIGTSAPVFTVELTPVRQRDSTEPRPGVVRIVSRGCSGLDPRCVSAASGHADAYAEVSMQVALVHALATAPAAPLTTRLDVLLPALALRLVNLDAGTHGVTVHAGGRVDAPAARSISRPGTPGPASQIALDGQLSTLTADRFFSSYFGIDRATFRRLPGVVHVDCGEGDCADALAAAAERHTRLLWVAGDLNLPTGMTLGSASEPVLLVVDGALRLGGAVQITGLVYARGMHWDATDADSASVRGAVLLEETCCSGSGAASLIYDAQVLERLRRLSGSFAQVPGSWRDF